MRAGLKRIIALVTVLSIFAGMAGCSHKQKKTPKPQPQPTVAVNNGNADAKGEGDGQSDVPLVIGCNKLSKKFNPFVAKSEDDEQAVGLTQLYLTGNDRQGRIIYNGIDGEVRTYKGRDYTYYGPADIKAIYNKKKDKTVYRITLRNDIKFSDGEPVTIDDVLFTMYVLCDKDYNGSSSLGRQNIKGLLKYQKNKKVKKIAGINRINDYMMTVTTNGYDASMLKSLRIPVCPLHYYGNIEKYNYAKNRFGFKKGDISSVCANKSSPIGAGPYRFVKYEKKIIYYTSNEIYYKGCPKIAYVQLKEMEKILNTTQAKIDRIPEEEPESTFNRNAVALEITEGTVDVFNTTLSKEDIYWVAYANSNDKISGNKINTNFMPTGVYQYIGINADTVKTGRDAYSKKSRNLRKAFATAFSAFRSNLYDYYMDGTCIIQYPVSSSSWLSVHENEKGYSEAYNSDINGSQIYNKETGREEKYEYVKEAVLSYLEAAGYTIDGKKAISAPEGAKMSYMVIIDGGEDNPLYGMVSETAALLHDIGINLRIVPADAGKQYENKLASGKQQFWTGQCDTNEEDSLYAKYLDKNDIFGIRQSGFGKLLKQTEKAAKDARRKRLYKRSYQKIFNIAVEVPVCEQQMAMMYSPARIDMDTMTKDITGYYSWINEIENIEMK